MSCHKQKFNKFSVFIAGFHSLHSSLVINIKFEWCSCLRPLSPETVWAEIVVERGWWSPPRAWRWCWWRWGRRRQRSSRWTVVADTPSTRPGVKHSSPYTTFLVIEIERKFSSGAHAISLIELSDVGCCSEKQCLKLKSYIMRWIKTCFIGFPNDHLISIAIASYQPYSFTDWHKIYNLLLLLCGVQCCC